MRFKFLSKLILIFVLLLASAFAAGYSDTVIMDKNNFDVQFYNCGSDTSCRNPSLVFEDHTNINKYTFNYFTDDYYAEYLFKQGYLAKGFIVHKYTGTNNYNFDKKDYCNAPITSISISNNQPTQGDLINVNVNVQSAFQGSDTGTPKYRPNKYTDWFDADTRIRLQIIQNGNAIQEFVQDYSIYMESSHLFTFQLSTTGLQGNYQINVITEVVDEICNQNNDIVNQNSASINVLPVSAPQAPVANAGNDVTTCINTNVIFNGSSSYDPDGSINNYAWNFGDSSSGIGAIVNHIYTSLGIYNVILFVVDNTNLQDSDNMVVTVNNCTNQTFPTVTITADPEEGDEPLEVEFESSVTGISPFTYFWNFDDGTNSTQANPTHTFDDAGNYDVVLTVRDANNNTASDSITIEVNEDDTDNSDSDGNGDSDTHQLSIRHVSLDADEFYAGDKIKLEIEIKNTGDLDENNIQLKALITELGISKSITGINLPVGSNKWLSLELDIPSDVEQGLYNIRIELSNSHYIDTEYKVITIKQKTNSEVLLNTDDKNKEYNWLFILEIVFASLLIILLLLGIAILIREISKNRGYKAL